MTSLEWSAHPSNDETRLIALSNPSALDWFSIDVPGEWRSAPRLADHGGSVLYRTIFTSPVERDDQRLFVRSEGIFDRADLWLDGAYLGDQDDYFLPHSYDITGLSALGSEHTLVVEVSGSAHAGPWRPISLVTTGPAALQSLRVLCRDASDERAHLLLQARVDCDAPRPITIRTTVGGTVVAERVHRVARGENEVSWSVDVAHPALWWPWSLGAQTLTDIEVTVLVDGTPSDSLLRVTGLREIAADHWSITVNGERLYCKGAYLDLPDVDLGATPPQWHADNVAHARGAGLDLLRLHHHVAHPALYEAADAGGLLLWQDVPPRPSGKRGRRRAVRWVTGLVDALGHHPSIAFWHHDVLDRWTRSAIQRNDPTRTALGHLSTAIPERAIDDPRAALLRGSLAGAGRDFASAVTVIPNLGRFPTHEQWRVIEPDVGSSTHSATMIARTIAQLRLIRFRPGTGFAFVKLRDDSVLDDSGLVSFAGDKRVTYDAVAAACRPVMVIADDMARQVSAGVPVSRDLFVVNDTPREYVEARVTAVVRLPHGDGVTVRRSEWVGDVPAGDVIRIGELTFTPPRSGGAIEVELTLRHPDLAEHGGPDVAVALVVDIAGADPLSDPSR